ncbi:dTDP-4-dehydrorhamnose reductase [Paenibacillus polysaccharolyticus]|uniref:dTDP-4-dehydrorhamnose reductase n=1 Tax=Paenibacillus polysaccharolyticus TaxID=582692 RepID=UPI003009D030
MKILVTGTDGQLGFDMIRTLFNNKIEHCAIGRSELDLRNFEKTRNYICSYLPDVIVHCAAYTSVDRAENEKELCRMVNVEVTENISRICKDIGSSLVYISTDYVFSGEGTKPYEVDSLTDPKTVYGQSKLDGENRVLSHLDKYFIVRTSWSFGINGNNFIKTMLKLGTENEFVNVVGDQIGSPTYTKDLAEVIVHLVQTNNYGIYHITNEGFCSWADFASYVFESSNINTKVRSITSEEYSAIAQRPYNSRLSKSSLDDAKLPRLPHWKDAVNRYLKELNANISKSNEGTIDNEIFGEF